MCRQLSVDRLPRVRLLQMDATRMDFPPGSFDFVYSYDVFEHFPDPAAVLAQIRSVLRPGGVCLTIIHPYTCDTGCHDMRLYLPGRAELPHWPHLRPQTREQVQSFAYLNKLTLRQWHELFNGASFTNWKLDDGTEQALAEARSRGELAEYSDDDLLTDRLVV